MEWPTKVDVAGSAFSLFTIQYTYRIPVVNLARGILGQITTSAKLTVEDIEEIVNNRLEDHNTISHFPGKDYALAIEWVEGAIRWVVCNLCIVCLPQYFKVNLVINEIR